MKPEAQHFDPLEAIANNGHRHHNVYSWHFRFAGDRIELLREYRDTHHSRVAIGF